MPALARPLPLTEPHALAFDSFFRAWFWPITRWLPAMGVPRCDVEDVAQEVLLTARARFDSFDGTAPSAWLYAISIRLASNHRRRAWARRLVASDELVDGAASPETPESLAGQRELGRLGESMLAGLSDKLRRVFVLAELEGYSGKEIAALEQIPAATVFTRLHHARRQLEARTGGQRAHVLRLLVALALVCLVSLASAMIWRRCHRVEPTFAPSSEVSEPLHQRTSPTCVVPSSTARAEAPHHRAPVIRDEPAPANDDAEQAQLLLDAYAAAHHDRPEVAIERVDEYLRRYPDGALLDEALVVALDTASDDLARARPYARLYLARLPAGVHAGRARALLAD